METHVVAYDIRDPKRLRRVAKTCEDFGCRRQLSIFLCRISAVDLVRLKARLEDIIDPQARPGDLHSTVRRLRRRYRSAGGADTGIRCAGCGDRELRGRNSI